MMILKPFGARLLVLMSAVTLSACQIGTSADAASVANQSNKASWRLPTTPQTWQAMSRTATGITGDIIVTRDDIVFKNGASIQIKAVDQNFETGTTLYQVTSKNNPVLLNGNLLCGEAPVNYLTLQRSEPGQAADLSMTVYYYPETLRLRDLPLSDQSDTTRSMCAIYNYIQ